MQLTSSAFQHEGKIPAKFTCDGENQSPDFSWSDAPAQTKSFALIMHDPDAPRAGGFTHWVMYDIPPGTGALSPSMPKQERVAGAGLQGKNDSGKIGYMGPCPPSGTHRYYVRLYALDNELKLDPGATREQLENSIRGHVLEQAELMGTYARSSERAA